MYPSATDGLQRRPGIASQRERNRVSFLSDAFGLRSVRRYYSDFIGPADAAVRAEVEVDEELDAEEQEKLKGTKEEMKRVFDRIDENGNGCVHGPFVLLIPVLLRISFTLQHGWGCSRYLDAEELRKLAGIIDPDGLSSAELEAALSMMDEDGDDEIDFEEFFDWWSGKLLFTHTWIGS